MNVISIVFTVIYVNLPTMLDFAAAAVGMTKTCRHRLQVLAVDAAELVASAVAPVVMVVVRLAAHWVRIARKAAAAQIEAAVVALATFIINAAADNTDNEKREAAVTASNPDRVSVAGKVHNVADKVVDVADKVVDVADKTVDVADKTGDVADKTENDDVMSTPRGSPKRPRVLCGQPRSPTGVMDDWATVPALALDAFELLPPLPAAIYWPSMETTRADCMAMAMVYGHTFESRVWPADGCGVGIERVVALDAAPNGARAKALARHHELWGGRM